MQSVRVKILYCGLLLVLVACNSSASLASIPSTITAVPERVSTDATLQTLPPETSTLVGPTNPEQRKTALAGELIKAGIICLQVVPAKGVLAATYSLDYVSIDGGMTWVMSNPNDPHEHPACADKYFREPKQLIYKGLGSPDVSYWFYPDTIRRSNAEHSGITDELEINPPVTFYDVGYDEMTGHIIAAIGRDGVLVRTPDAQWHFVTVGPYAR